MKELGAKKKEKREKLDIPLAQARNETKIRMIYLEAIEEGNFEEVEREVYLKGFLKVYAKYLGLDERKIMQEYREYKKIKEQENKTEEEIEKDKTKKTLKERLKKFVDYHQNKFLYAFITVIILLLIVAVLFLGTMIYKSFSSEAEGLNLFSNLESYINKIELENKEEDNSSKVESKSSVQNDDKSSTEKNNQENKKTQNNNENDQIKIEKAGLSQDQNLNSDKMKTEEIIKEETIKQINLELKAIRDSWCAVEVNGDSKFKGIIKEGTTKSFSGKNIKLKIANAAGVKVIKNGQEFGPFGKAGEVVVKEYSIKSN